MVLSNTAILQALANRSLRVTPTPAPEEISVTSLDCNLGPIIYTLHQSVYGADPITKLYFDPETATIQEFWAQHGITIDLRSGLEGYGPGYCLRPGEICLATTAQRITLPLDGKQVLQGRINNRSRTARTFLRIHVDAPEIKPGTDNPITLEIKNEAPFNVRLYAGMPIAQISFEEVRGIPTPSPSDFHGQINAIGEHLI